MQLATDYGKYTSFEGYHISYKRIQLVNQFGLINFLAQLILSPESLMLCD